MKYQEIGQDFVDRVIPARRPDSHKDDYGRVLALCGSRGYTGAAYFAAQAAVRTGSGVVTLCTPEEVYPILAGKLNEPVVYPVACNEDGRLTAQGAVQALAHCRKLDAVLIGCGLGLSDGVREAVQEVLRQVHCPVIVDADGINALSGHIDVLRNTAASVILTPHAGEFRRLIGSSTARENDAAAFSRETGAIVLLKGHRSVLCTPDGKRFRNTTGNPGMAKGGSGDVLSGILLSLCGQGLRAADAACAGMYLHGAAGDHCANTLGEYGMTPSDVLHALPMVLRRYNTREW